MCIRCLNQFLLVLLHQWQLTQLKKLNSMYFPEPSLTFPLQFSVSLYRQKNDSQSESPEQKPWKMVEDAVLQSLIRKVKESILLKEDQHEQYTALAR